MKKSSPHKSPRDLLIDDLTALRNQARSHVIRAGVQQQEFETPIKGIEDFTNEQIADLLVWQREFNQTALKEVLSIWNLKEEGWWENLTMFGLHKTREQKLLRAAQKKLRQAWRAQNPKIAPPPEEENAESA